MVSAIDQRTRKLGEKKNVQAETITGSSLQQSNTKSFAVEALRRESGLKIAYLLEYQSVIRMVEALMHRNPLCHGTVCNYLYNVHSTIRILHKTPDDIVADARAMSEDDLEQLLMGVDQVWIQKLNSTATRMGKWASIRTFLIANGVRTVKLLSMRMQRYRKYSDQTLTREDCRKLLDAARNIQDKRRRQAPVLPLRGKV